MEQKSIATRDRCENTGFLDWFVYWGGDALAGHFYPVHSKIAHGDRTITLQTILVAAPEMLFYD